MASGSTLDFILAVVFGLLTAVVNAIALMTQHIASNRIIRETRGWRIVIDLAKQPLWLLGWIALAGSLAFQAIALYFGPVGLVQPLLIGELIIALLIRKLFLHQHLRLITIGASISTTALLAIFIAYASPRSGRIHVPGTTWGVSIGICTVVVFLLWLASLRGTPKSKAALLGTATAITWALEAVLIKVFSDNLAAYGLLGSLSHWPVYAFVGYGVAGLYFEQAALYVGPLSVSQPLIVIVDPLVSVILGVALFAERWRGGVTHLVFGLMTLAAIFISAWILIETSPETMHKSPDRVETEQR